MTMITTDAEQFYWLSLHPNPRSTLHCPIVSLRKQPTFYAATAGFPAKWRHEMNAEIPYWWCITTQIWVVRLIGWSKFPTWHDQSEVLPSCRKWRIISMEFLHSFLRCHLWTNQCWRRAGLTVTWERVQFNFGCVHDLFYFSCVYI